MIYFAIKIGDGPNTKVSMLKGFLDGYFLAGEALHKSAKDGVLVEVVDGHSCLVLPALISMVNGDSG
jgi:hypothetical protein